MGRGKLPGGYELKVRERRQGQLARSFVGEFLNLSEVRPPTLASGKPLQSSPLDFLRSDRAIEVRGAHPSKTTKGGAASVGVIQSKIKSAVSVATLLLRVSVRNTGMAAIHSSTIQSA